MPRFLSHRILVMAIALMAWPAWSDVLSAQQAEDWLQAQQHPLLHGSEDDHVVSYYYFGRYEQRTLIGLERVIGPHYQSNFTLLVFEGGALLGFYQPLKSLPLRVDDAGVVQFPPRFRPAAGQATLSLARDVREFMPLCLAEFRPCARWQSEHSDD